MKKLFLITLILAFAAFFVQPTIPFISKAGFVSAQEGEIEAPPEEPAMVNINTASAEELATLEGIGDVIAQAIVEYRDANGPFKSIEDVKNVKGVGEKKFEGIKDKIAVE